MAPRNSLLDTPILAVSKVDIVRLRRFLNGGTVITGALGSGKSSTSLRALCYGMMDAGLGGLFCTVKADDTDTYLSYAKACGREKDVIVFNAESGLSFDPLAYLWSTGRGAGDVEAIIDFFNTLLSIGKQHVGMNNDRFWELAAEQAMRHSIHLLRLAGKQPTIIDIYRAIQSFPRYPGQQEESAWQEQSFTASLINTIKRRKETLSPIEWADLDVATEFVFSKWASYDEKPRSSIEMTFSGMADKFLFSPFREMFCSGRYDFTPEQVTHQGKLIILDIPVLAYGRETARLMQILVKLVFQRAWLRHPFKQGCCNGAMLIQDEFQMLMSRFENHFVQVCRASCIAPIFITQTILNLAEEMGESQPGAKSKAFLNNLSIKIAHRSTCPETSSYIADVIGKEYRYLDGYNAGGGRETHAGVSGTKQLVHILEPTAFSGLVTPDAANPYSEAIVFCGGDTFDVTKTPQNPKGSNYLRVMFSRNT